MRIETPTPPAACCEHCKMPAIYIRTRIFETSESRVWMCTTKGCETRNLYFHTDGHPKPVKKEWLPIGTRSVLFGAHQFLIHPICLALAWRRLYGFPWHPFLWLCFVVHDLGYWGKPDIDGKAGTTHPELGARIMLLVTGSLYWHNFCLFHSRHYAKAMAKTTSRLCVADKLAFAITPRWLYLLTTGVTGELAEYMANGTHAKSPPCTAHEVWCLRSNAPEFWHDGLRSYMIRWTAKHHHDQDDSWTQLETGR